MQDLAKLKQKARQRYVNLVKRSILYKQPYPSFEEFYAIILESYNKGFKCEYCDVELEISGSRDEFKRVFSIDHNIPLNKGGTNSKENLIVCCARCNFVKGTITGTTFKRMVNLLKKEDPEFFEQFMEEAFESAYASKLERKRKEEKFKS